MALHETYFGTTGMTALSRAVGRSVVYLQQGKSPRTITAATTEEHKQVVPKQHGLVVEESILALVLRDSVKGIDDPQLGDGLRRAEDGNEYVFSFDGTILHQQETTWQLRFVRERPYQVGGKSIP